MSEDGWVAQRGLWWLGWPGTRTSIGWLGCGAPAASCCAEMGLKRRRRARLSRERAGDSVSQRPMKQVPYSAEVPVLMFSHGTKLRTDSGLMSALDF